MHTIRRKHEVQQQPHRCARLKRPLAVVRQDENKRK
jgi:hypothetical protein